MDELVFPCSAVDEGRKCVLFLLLLFVYFFYYLNYFTFLYFFYQAAVAIKISNLLVYVALICLVLYLRKITLGLLNCFILYCFIV